MEAHSTLIKRPPTAASTTTHVDLDRVTRRFCEEFKTAHATLSISIEGLGRVGQRDNYAMLMLSRLMFVYFLQAGGWLDGDVDYLGRRLAAATGSFYQFLRRLFHEGLNRSQAKRDTESSYSFGAVPALELALFKEHALERRSKHLHIPDQSFRALFEFFDQYEWALNDLPPSNERQINPDILGYVLERIINQKQMGAYYTKADVTQYIGRHTILPRWLATVESLSGESFGADHQVWKLLQDDPNRYIPQAVGHGVFVDYHTGVPIDVPEPLPAIIAAGADDMGCRAAWNQQAPSELALPTETWREVVARRQKCSVLQATLAAGKITTINDLITHNLEIGQFALDVIHAFRTEEWAIACYTALAGCQPATEEQLDCQPLRILDPTCGSGAFLFAAIATLQPLYKACLNRLASLNSPLAGSIIDLANQSANRKYFILKNIVSKNLFGVDLMPDAVEVCQLRLALKLFSAIHPANVADSFRLPNLELNFRTGNALIGFATWEKVRQMSDGSPGFDQESDLAMQRPAGDPERQAETIDQLDKYLAARHGVDPTDTGQLNDWKLTHRPFHWCVEFFDIMQTGGFNVVFGNPPYVEYHKVKHEYTLHGFDTHSCGNLYAFTFERCLSLCDENQRLGLIVPLSVATTKRMAPLQAKLRSIGSLWLSHFDVYPSKLFEGAKQRLTIALTAAASSDAPAVWSTRYQRWKPAERPMLLDTMHYSRSGYRDELHSFPKLGGLLDANILAKLSKFKPAPIVSDRQQPTLYVHRIPYNYIKAFDFVPYFWNQVDGEKKSEDYKPFRAASYEFTGPILASLNSNLFFWWWYCLFEGYHCGRHELMAFPLGVDSMSLGVADELSSLATRLMFDFRRNKNRRECTYKTTGQVVYDEFFPRRSKSIIDEIDTVLASHYRLTAEELDHILNFDIKYRT